MGGSTFTKASADGAPTLYTPRMTPKVYAQLKSTCIERLQEVLPDHQISALIEAPEKKDYGDLDIIIAHDGPVNTMELARHVGAHGLIKHSTGENQSFSLAVPQDMVRSVEDRDPVIYKHRHKTDTSITENHPPAPLSTKVYAQIDVHIVNTADYDWHIFYSSYGDLNILLGHIVRQHGFSLTDKGLFLRLPEYDAAKELDAERTTPHLNIEDTLGKLFLSNDPVEVMDFLGLDPSRYYDGFTTVKDFFDWLSMSRLVDSTTVGGHSDQPSTKTSAKPRSLKRPLFTSFLDDYLPKKFKHISTANGTNSKEVVACETCKQPVPSSIPSRPVLHREAVASFARKSAYTDLHTKLIHTISNQEADHFLKPIIAKYSNSTDRKKIGEILRAMQRWVGVGECCGKMSVLEEPHGIGESQLGRSVDGSRREVVLRDEAGVEVWVKEHWDEVKGIERQRVKREREGKELKEG
ncbi:unnamed protein product [Zymoseptoria tritici ST99CH_3D1]|nr:unnamed protein product [Zymoseptoria tritici ST99CH_3D1]